MVRKPFGGGVLSSPPAGKKSRMKLLGEFIHHFGYTEDSFAEEMGVDIDTVHSWLYKGKKIPPYVFKFLDAIATNYRSGV